MGYYTNFRLTLIDTKTGDEIRPESTVYEEVKKTFLKVFGEKESNDCSYFDELADGGVFSWRWYEHHTDMKKMAEAFPNIHFSLEGQGEDPEEIWIKDYWGKKFCVRRATIVFPKDKPLVWKEED